MRRLLAVVLTLSIAGCSDDSTAIGTPVARMARSQQDRPDDLSGPQVHAVYAVPLGGSDRGFDTLYDIAYSVQAFQRWLAATSGLQIRFDTYEGGLDVSFLQLDRSDAEMNAFGVYLATELERQLAATDVMQPHKRYIIYYDGGSGVRHCGGAAWPPSVPGQAASMYLHACVPSHLVNQPDAAPGYWEFAALHDLVHTFGIVSPGAPHAAPNDPAHVRESYDLMYGGASGPWSPVYVDVENDDYYAPSLPDGLANLSASPFVAPAPQPSPTQSGKVRVGPPTPAPVFGPGWAPHQAFTPKP